MWGYYSASNNVSFEDESFVQPLPIPGQRFPGDDLVWSPAQLRHYQVTRGQAVALFAGLDGSAQDGTQEELFELEDYFAALERSCGKLARDMVTNLVSPTERCGKEILDAAARKQLKQQQLKSASQEARRHQPRGVQHEIRLSQRVVRSALGISASEWNRNMTKIKAFTRSWLER